VRARQTAARASTARATERDTPDFRALQADLSEGRSDRFLCYLVDLRNLGGSKLDNFDKPAGITFDLEDWLEVALLGPRRQESAPLRARAGAPSPTPLA